MLVALSLSCFAVWFATSIFQAVSKSFPGVCALALSFFQRLDNSEAFPRFRPVASKQYLARRDKKAKLLQHATHGRSFMSGLSETGNGKYQSTLGTSCRQKQLIPHTNSARPSHSPQPRPMDSIFALKFRQTKTSKPLLQRRPTSFCAWF